MGDAASERERDGEGEVAGEDGAGEAEGESGAAVASGVGFVSLPAGFFLAEAVFLTWSREKQVTFVSNKGVGEVRERPRW